MTHHQFLRIKKLTGKAIIQVAAKHNHREILAEMGAAQGGHIDPSRTRGNIVLRGCDTAASVAGVAQSLMDSADVKPLRKDAVRALEIIFSLPPETAIDLRRYFDDATAWLEQYFAAPVISAIVHHDEAAPHCHVLLLPLVGGRMIGSDLMGGRAKLQALQADFHAQVGVRYGLMRQTPHKRLSAAIRRQAVNSAFDALEVNSGMNDALLRVLIEPHLKNPEPLLLALGLDMPQPKANSTFVKIMTKPCKPEKPIGFTRSKPIGFGAAATPEKEQTLSCVGFGIPGTPIPPVIEQQDDAIQGDYIRQRDADQPSGYWDESTGDFIKPMVKASCKQAVMASVNIALESIGASNKSHAGRCD
ncbi:plasmid recombination protein [Herminiimonas sp. CN]|uniref:plasmid recombination protein n=1 Tax=Herminiimonas sp. CN TaxID=1349818 RepID=UPI000473A048|nr:plasmid recombination protein [Herminiimonas sp. CN]